VLLSGNELTELLWKFSNADAMGRGHGTTVAPFKSTKDVTNNFLFDQFAADLGDVKVQDVKFSKLLPREKKRYVMGKAAYIGGISFISCY
jgi:hypothetical protein